MRDNLIEASSIGWTTKLLLQATNARSQQYIFLVVSAAIHISRGTADKL